MQDDITIRARNFAYNKHDVPQECKRYGNSPYSVHIENVVEYIKKYSYYIDKNEINDVICAGYLHDTIEDTPTTPTIIRKLFNDRIADIVFAVTNERDIISTLKN